MGTILEYLDRIVQENSNAVATAVDRDEIRPSVAVEIGTEEPGGRAIHRNRLRSLKDSLGEEIRRDAGKDHRSRKHDPENES